MYVCIALCTIVAHNIARNRPDCPDDVYLREGGQRADARVCVDMYVSAQIHMHPLTV